MTYEALVVPRGGIKPLVSTLESRGDPLSEPFWRGVTVKIAERSDNGPQSVEIHLVVPNTCEWLYDEDALIHIVTLARNHGWGAPIYLTVNGSVPLEPKDAPNTEQLIKTAWRAGVADILETASILPADMASLRAATTRSLRRRALCRARPEVKRWLCLAPERMTIWSRLFGEHIHDPSREPASDPWGALIPVFRSSAGDLSPPPLWKRPPRACVFALVDGAEVRAPQGTPIAEVRTALEARYLFERLLHTEREHCFPVPIDQTWEPRRVRVAPSPVFSRWAPRDASDIVITSAFTPSDDPEGTQIAAREVGALVHGLPRDHQCHVYPAANGVDLDHTISGMEHITAWVHLSHGVAAYGMQQANGTFAPPEQWLHAFRGRKRSLLVAVFSTQESSDIARIFAEQGTAVSIGFEGRSVPQEDCHYLTTEVLNAAVRFREPAAVLQAFQRGVHRLKSDSLQAKPVAYHAA